MTETTTVSFTITGIEPVRAGRGELPACDPIPVVVLISSEIDLPAGAETDHLQIVQALVTVVAHDRIEL